MTNITSNPAEAKAFFRELIPLRIRWVGESNINAAHDEEFLDLLKRSGCMGVLIGFESLNPANLAAINKTINTARGRFARALENLRKLRIRCASSDVATACRIRASRNWRRPS